MKNIKAIQKYLDTYAESEARQSLNISWQCSYKNALVIPVYREKHTFLDQLLKNIARRTKEESLCRNNKSPQKSFLLTLIINQPSNISAEASKLAHEKNTALLEHIRSTYTLKDTIENLSYFQTFNNFDLVTVDRFSEKRQIPEKQGVGLARKIGADIASELIHSQIIEIPLIFSSDADSELPRNYFELANRQIKEKRYAALIYDFKHVQNNKSENPLCLHATKVYEACIKLYANELAKSGSPYGYCTLGSCLAISFEHYCLTRGFPKRSGGEDFYLLNKLRKLDDILSLKNSQIKINARTSKRVPFGTGPATEKLMDTLASGKLPKYYSLETFKYLKALLSYFNVRTAPSSYQNLKASIKIGMIRQPTSGLSLSIMFEALDAIGINSFFEHVSKQNIDETKIKTEFNNWFDAFKTLKFIHHLSNKAFPKITIDLLDIDTAIHRQK